MFFFLSLPHSLSLPPVLALPFSLALYFSLFPIYLYFFFSLFLYLSLSLFLSLYEHEKQLVEDCEQNDGSDARPYYMSRRLMKILAIHRASATYHKLADDTTVRFNEY